MGFFSKFICLIIGVSVFSFAAKAQDQPATDSVSIYEKLLEELLNLKSTDEISAELESKINASTGLTGNKGFTARNPPNILSYITKEEIQNSGARDLIDVLRLVPGFDFGVDVQGVVGIGVRGNWAHEGKLLLLIDGQEMNEVFYATNQFGNHYSIDQIEKIEIIRGSAIYGGFAEYGVINIITQKGETINGVKLTANNGKMQDAFGRQNANLMLGKKFGNTDVAVKGFYELGNRSDATYYDIYDGNYNMTKNAPLNSSNLNIGISNKNLSITAIADQYNTKSQNAYGSVLTKPYDVYFLSYYFEAKYNLKLNEKFTLTPKYNFKRQLPWNFVAGENEVDSLDMGDVYTYNKQII